MAVLLPMRHLLPLLCCAALAAVEIQLQAPLTTRIGIDHTGGAVRLEATLTIPPGASPDLGAAIWVADRHGRWWQRALPDALTPGRRSVSLSIHGESPLEPQGHGAPWNAGQLSEIRRAGLVFWSTVPGGRVTIDGLRLASIPDVRHSGHRLVITDLAPVALSTRTRWQVRVRPEPWPTDPWDPEAFNLALTASPASGEPLVTAGFHDQPMRNWDRGDREEVQPWGPAAFAARTRATQPGTWRLRLAGRWANGATATCDLPALQASGPAGDGIARVDGDDPRFLSADGALVWPIGPNIHTIWDLRGVERTGSKLTPDRGTFSYLAWFDRMAASGATGCEIWLSSWNLALEWNGAWWPWRGQGRISEERAWQLDQVLALAEARGIRVNLVVQNHGQASVRTDAEWDRSPANRANGGWLDDAAEWFSDSRALAAQERSRRHLVAHYGDSPAILGWKLWSEVNLTELGHRAGGGEGEKIQVKSRNIMRSWHAAAAARWQAIDPWRHPCTTHWAGNYQSPDRAVASLPGLGFICIDAYHGPDGPPVWVWLARSTRDPARPNGDGLAGLGKPILVTEYGGDWDAAPEPMLEVALTVGGWVGLVTGHAGTPMLWWHEWIDQGNRFGQYQALSRFLAGEDLRGALRRSIVINAGPLTWSRAWAGPGRMLGYIIDEAWGRRGGAAEERPASTVVLGNSVAPGAMQVAWWDADRGSEIARMRIDHPGGRLEVARPAFSRHLAFKAWR